MCYNDNVRKRESDIMKKLIDLLERCGADVDYYNNIENLEITFNDFKGFDEDFEEIYREYENPNAVEEVKQYLDNNAKLVSNYTCYKVYSLDNRTIIVGYASADI